MYFEKRFGGYSKSVTLDEEKSKKLATILFVLIGLVFMAAGAIFINTTPDHEDYVKNGEYEFSFYQTNRKISTSRNRAGGVSRTSTKTSYVPMYLGFVGDNSYTYEYHEDYSTEKKAQEFTDANQTLMVSTYLDKKKELFLLASDITLEEYFNAQRVFGMVFVGVGGLLFVVGVFVRLIPKKRVMDGCELR